MKLRFGKVYTGGFYHVFNRGVDKRIIFKDRHDMNRFLLLMRAINSEKLIGSIKSLQQNDIHKHINEISQEDKLVHMYGFALVQNHFHFVLKQNKEDGVAKFMHRLSSGYARFFNEKYDRVGTLFSGRYKYIELDHDARVIKMIGYVNRNNEIHGCSNRVTVRAQGSFILGGFTAIIKR